MLIAYASTSTRQHAGLAAQERDLKALGVDRLFMEQISSVGPRKALQEAIDFARPGDTIVVTKLDRLARSVTHLGSVLEMLTSKGVDATHHQPRRRYRHAHR